VTRYEITIDDLVLRGVPAAQAAEVAAAAERRLADLAASAPDGALRNVSLDGVPTRSVLAADAAALGHGIADRVWSAATGTEGGSR